MSPLQRLVAALAVGAVLLALSPRLTATTSAAFSGSTSNAANAFGADTMNPPGTPLSVHKSAVGGMVQLSWTASSSNYVTGYTVQRAPAGSSSYTTIASIPLGISGFTEFSTGLTAASSPWDITTGPDGNLWFTENAGNRIGKITPTGTITEYVIPTAASSPKGITAGPDGNLWFTESATDKIGRITTGGVFTEWPLTALRGPQSVVAGPDGAMWFTQSGINKLGRITVDGTRSEVGAIGAGGDRTNGITVGPGGDLWVTQTAVNKVSRVTTAGVDSNYSLTTNGAPNGITVGPSGNLRIAQTATSKIGKLTPTADAPSVTDIAAAGGPAEIAPGPDGNVWYTESTGNRIASIRSSDDGISGYTIPTAASSPYGITAGPDGNIWFTEKAGNKIGRYGLGLSTSYVDTTAAYDAQYSYRVIATYKSWTATGGNNMSLSLNPTSGTDRTPTTPGALVAADLTNLAYPDKAVLATNATWVNNRPYSTAKIHGLQWGDATTAYAFGSGGEILKSTDGGVDWVAQTSGTTNNLEEGACVSVTTCWAVGASGTIRYTSDGTSWGTQNSGTANALNGVTAVDATHVWAGGLIGTILFFNGTTWAAQTSASALDVYDITAFDATHVWAVGKTGTIQFFNGSTWTAQTSPLANNLNSVDFISTTTGWITGDKGTILMTTDGGQTWTAQTAPSGTAIHLRGLDMLDATHGWASGDSGTMLFYNGTAWTAQTVDVALDKIQAVAFYDANTGLLGTDPKNSALDLQITQNGGTTWIPLENQNLEVAFSPTVVAGAPLTSVKATVMYRTSAVNAATGYWLLMSYDAGASWRYYPLAAPSGNNATSTGTVDLSSVITTPTRLQNLRLRYYVDQGNNATGSLDVIQVQVN